MNKNYNISDASVALLLAVILLLTAACSTDSSSDPQPQNNQQEITLAPTVWQMMEGTRATFYDTGALASGSFTAACYVEDSETAYISPVTVDWDDEKDRWEWSDGNHYWPASGNLDFFAYMPKAGSGSLPSYITSGPTYSVSGEPATPQASFTCANLPMTYDAASPTAGQGSSLQEFIWGITVGQNKTGQGETGVTMKFHHPFARIRFQLAASHPNIQINSITFKKLKTGGTCTLNATGIEDSYYYKTCAWTNLTPAESTSDLVMTLSGDASTFNSNPASVVPIGGYESSAHQYVNLLVVPQAFAGQIAVNATWTDKSLTQTVTATISTITWQAGYSYTYTFTISPNDLTVNTEKFTEQW